MRRLTLPAGTARFLLAATAAVAIAHLLDPWAVKALAVADFGDTDLGRMLRSLGYLPFWLVAALALALAGGTPDRIRRGGLLATAVVSGGLLAEVLKTFTGRLRPEAEFTGYHFRHWADVPFTDLTVNVGLPSSHALVAFAAAFTLTRLFPEGRWVWIALAIGCAYSRVATNAHFLSDVTASAVVAYLLVSFLWWRHRRTTVRRAVA